MKKLKIVCFPTVCVLFYCLFSTSECEAARAARSGSQLRMANPIAGSEFKGQVWGLLISGSMGYGNYRHQADVAHAWQVLRKGGVPAANIVTMMYDDVAHDESNPHKGKLFNKPGGPNVYEGLVVDYRGETVIAQNVLEVLAGRENAPTILGGSGKTIKSQAGDRVWVYYADHGAPGILGMPTGDYLFADQLVSTILKKSAAGGFSEMVVYIEACESGSIFQGTLNESVPVYALTAANAMESSWGVYCPGQYPPPSAEFDTCLGDLFSISFLEDDDTQDSTRESLKEQFDIVRRRTSQNGTFIQGSHVLQFGDLSIEKEPVGNYQGNNATAVSLEVEQWARRTVGAVPQRDADLIPLLRAAQQAPHSQVAAAALHAALAQRRAVDHSVYLTVTGLLHDPATGLLLEDGLLGSQYSVEAIMTRPLGRSPTAAVVDDWDCLRRMFSAWSSSCGRLDQYGMKHSRTFANLCNAGISPDLLGAHAASSCTSSHVL